MAKVLPLARIADEAQNATRAEPNLREIVMSQTAMERRAEAFRATREAHASEVADDYVELIGDLIAEHGEARLTDLAGHMGVAQPTAAKIVRRLKTLGLVESRPYRSLFLTPAGDSAAAKSRARHKAVVEFLIAIGVSETTAEIDAEGMEHHVSDETLRRMALAARR
jgi:DtxR family manganese transport transcriptional regulator